MITRLDASRYCCFERLDTYMAFASMHTEVQTWILAGGAV